MEDTKNDVLEIDLLELARALWRNALAIVLVAALCAAVAFGYTYMFISPRYDATTTLYVNNSSFSIGDTSFSVSSSQLSVSRNLVDTYILVLRSRTTLEQVIDTAGLSYSYGALSSMISVTPVSDTAAFEVTVSSGNPAEAELIANTIAAVLPERIADIVYGASVKVIDYAIIPSASSSPSYTRNTAIGALAGAVLAALVIVGISLLRSYTSATVDSSDDLKKLYPEFPVLAVIPDMRNLGRRSSYGYSGYGYGYGYGYYGGERSHKSAEKGNRGA